MDRRPRRRRLGRRRTEGQEPVFLLFVDWLWIRADRRGQGIGGRLLAAAEAEARARGCAGIYLGSFTFQAPDYYKRAGYSEFGRIDGFPPGHALVFLLKRLSAQALLRRPMRRSVAGRA